MSKKKITKVKPKAAKKPVKKAVKPAPKKTANAKSKAKPAPKKVTKVVSKKTVKAKPAPKKAVSKKPAVKKPVAKTPAAKPAAVAKKPAAPVKPASVSKKSAPAPVAKKSAPAPVTKKSAPAPVAKKAASVKTIEARPVRPESKNPVLPPMPPPIKPAISKSPLAPTAVTHQEDPNKTRYSDKELDEFRVIIETKLEESRRELSLLQAQMTAANEHGTDDTAGTFKMLEDGSESLAKEEAGQLAGRQKKFIEQLENALIRIENKTYGICRVTGKLIPKERLRAVPHTTQSIEAKINQYRD